MDTKFTWKKLIRTSEEETVESEVARFLLEYEGSYQKLQIKDIQDACYVSVATPTRLAKHLGFEGFNHLKYILEQERLHQIKKEKESCNVRNIVYFESLQTILKQTSVLLNEKDLYCVVEAIASSDRIDFYATGRTQLVAYDFHKQLIRLQKFSTAFSDSYEQDIQSTRAQINTVAFGVSASGKNERVFQNLERAKQQGAKTILLTVHTQLQFPYVDCVLYVGTTDILFLNSTSTSRISMYAVCDLLYHKLSNRMNET